MSDTAIVKPSEAKKFEGCEFAEVNVILNRYSEQELLEISQRIKGKKTPSQ